MEQKGQAKRKPVLWRVGMADLARSMIGVICMIVFVGGCTGSIERNDAGNNVATARAMVVDTRFDRHDTASLTATISEQTETRIIESVYGTGAPQSVAVHAHASGAFTRSGVVQTLYLLAPDQPLIAGLDAHPAILAIFEDGELLTQFVPPAQPYRDIRAVIDIDGDGVAEVLLQKSSYQMGHFISSIDSYSFKNGRKLLQQFKRVYDDGCDADPATGVSATTLTIDKAIDKGLAGLQRTDYFAACRRDQQPPAIQSFSEK